MSIVAATLAGLSVLCLYDGFSYVFHVAHEKFAKSAGAHGHLSVKGPQTPRVKGNKTAYRRPYTHGQTALCQPPKITQSPLDSWMLLPWTFPVGSVPAPGLIAQLDESGKDSSLINQTLYDNGGYAPFMLIQVVLQNPCPSDVTITSITVSKSCTPPNRGAIFYGAQADAAAAGSAGGAEQLGVDLDATDPEAMVVSGWNVASWRQPYDDGPLITIPADGVDVLDVRAIAPWSACTFSFAWTAVNSVTTWTETLNDDGQPFRVSAVLPGTATKSVHFPFAGYLRLYVGGPASPWRDWSWTRENPATWT
jgi:hypothetical protein